MANNTRDSSNGGPSRGGGTNRGDRSPSGREGDMSVREAGRRGGEATSASHGHEFYEEIGHKGGEKGGQRVSDLIEKGKQAEGRGGDNR